MLATIITVATTLAIAIVAFVVKARNDNREFKYIAEKFAILHEEYCKHTDSINANYQCLAELNRRQDLQEKEAAEREADLKSSIEELQTYNAEAVRNCTPKEKQVKVSKVADKHAAFAELRKTKSVKEAQAELGLSSTTARRYEQWRKEQEKE